MNKDTETPEQKALIEKEIFEEVAKIKDTQIRNYYTQEMKKRIYYTFGRGAEFKNSKPTNQTDKQPKNNEFYNKNSRNTLNKKQEFNLVKKPPLTDLFLRKIVAAMMLYPQLADAYGERLSSFDTGKSAIAKALNEIIEIVQEEPKIDSDILVEKLNLNFAKEIAELWEYNMYKMQKTDLPELKTEINDSLKEIQLKQIDNEIKECTKLMKSQPENSEEIYLRYKQLIAERNKFLATDEIL
jgi:DNA primase